MKRLTTVLLLIVTYSTFSCLNTDQGYYDVAYDAVEDYGYIDYFSTPNPYPQKSTIYQELGYLFSDLEYNSTENSDHIHCSIAAYYIYDGRYEFALAYLYKNVSNKQNNYNYASNIGVAHELIGDIDSAYYWTSKAIDLNHNSHQNSEWIHLKILGAEKALKKDPNWFVNHSIFDFDISMNETPTILPDSIFLDELMEQLSFQLNERTFFVKPEQQDPIVARLILLLADIYTRGYDAEASVPTYELAAKYDTNLQEIVLNRISYVKANSNALNLERDRYKDRNGNQIYLLGELNGMDTVNDYEYNRPKSKFGLYIILLFCALSLAVYIYFKGQQKR
jgi:hypothetical protein